MKQGLFILQVAFSLAACASTSGVMPNVDGTYTILGRAAPIRGGATGANAVAFKEAREFCMARGAEAQLVTTEDRDVYQSSLGGSWNGYGGGFGGSTMAAGNARIRFRCARSLQ